MTDHASMPHRNVNNPTGSPLSSYLASVIAFAAMLQLFQPLLGAVDREAVVARHNPTVTSVDPDAPLTVGNGGFAFTADITGLQTFDAHYHRWGVPTETLSRWAWHEEPNVHGYTLDQASKDYRHPDGRIVRYPTLQSSPAGDWLRRNPHNHPLGQLRLAVAMPGGRTLQPEDIQAPRQTLDLWRGVIDSRYAIGGQAVHVTTVCHPEWDLIGVRIASTLLANGRATIQLAFPKGYVMSIKNTPPLDWGDPEAHQTVVKQTSGRRADLTRRIDSTTYEVAVGWTSGASMTETAPHHYLVRAAEGQESIELIVAFSPSKIQKPLPTFEESLQASARHWKSFWSNGGFVDFGGSTHPLAEKLEKRTILSLYLLGAQSAGDVPPQETGLTCSTWYGKHHTEMIWWHTAPFALWGREALLEKNLGWYRRELPAARSLALMRGLRGARWAKMVGPAMRESPGGNPLIVWNQPHVIYLSELVYRNRPSSATLERYGTLVAETAECMASMLHFDAQKNVYVLGPPLWIAQEIYDQATSQNPSFELAYWRWGLETAQRWRERRGESRNEQWDHVLGHLAPIPVKDGRYVALGSNPDTFDTIASRHDHPTMLAPLGLLPGLGVDRAIMSKTLDGVLQMWDWETKIWGWDYPMIAMTATRLGRPETAIEVLLRDGPNNRYLPNGHCPQRSDEAAARSSKPGARKREIAVYLPANGAFLSAVALMAAGWDGSEVPSPGFSSDGRWTIKAEGLRRLP